MVVLTNGNYVVDSLHWSNGTNLEVGAVTWGRGATGISGPVSAANSLVGSTPIDRVGFDGVTVLANGNYVVSSEFWDNSGIPDAGAVTWGDGATGISGPVSVANSLVGSTQYDAIGLGGAVALTNGNYVMCSPKWDNGVIQEAGAATWCNGTTGTSGPVSTANSLVGSTLFDSIGSGRATALTNGNYVINSPVWNNGATAAVGAVTWGNGATGTTGLVSVANSLVGSSKVDLVGSLGVYPLTNGNYVVDSDGWDNGAIIDAGAVTWANGATGTTGLVSAANSLVGSSTFDRVGSGNIRRLANGNYVVASEFWDNGAINSAGAVTWGNGATGTSGPVSAANSLVGSSIGDHVGEFYQGAELDGNYLSYNPVWDNGWMSDAGAITFGLGYRPTVGLINSSNSFLGTMPYEGFRLRFAYDNANHQAVIGQLDNNIVTLFRVRGFDTCVQDDSNPNTSVAFDSQTGDYLFCAGGAQYSGTVTITRRGSTITLQHTASDRRLTITLDTAVNRATGSFQKIGLGVFTLTDRDTRNDACSCAAP
ncbi:MAG: hypothetical protein ACJ74G_16720 [Blastocatellia bacterium]